MTDNDSNFNLYDAIHHAIFMSEYRNEEVLEVLREIISDVEAHKAEVEQWPFYEE
jgi:hypothetical protein